MKKLTILLFSILILTSCSSSSPQQVKSSIQQIKLDSKSYDWKRWDCFDYGYAGEYLFTIGYIPELTKEGIYEGKLFLKDSKTPIDTLYSLQGVQHNFVWLNDSISGIEQSYQIVIDSDGTGRYWDFTGASEGEERTSKEIYECTSSDFVSFSKTVDNIFSY